MAFEFRKCEQCGIIFPSPGGKLDLCAKCRHEEAGDLSERDVLRTLKNTLRDAQCNGVFLTIAELASRTNVSEDTIWHFIHQGEIDTASFNDPDVRDFIVKRHRERLRASAQPPAAKVDEPAKPRPGGFHLKHKDDRPK